jgi:acyl-CoA synthetase (AMP-forming)/AMP-acid ligase II
MATATHGSALVFPSESFNGLATLKAVQEEKCTALYGVPTMFIEELGLLENGEVPYEGFQYLRTGIAAGSSIPAELMRKLHKTLNLRELTICYGMTETSPVSAMTTTDDPVEKRINSVGRLMPHVEAKIVDPADPSKILPVDTRGELAVSGYLLMKEYWGAPEKTAEVLIADESGKVWMHVSPYSFRFTESLLIRLTNLQTGDEASMSADGYIAITGRIKDLIIRGGENIHPLEIENCLLAHPVVSDISVVGVPDEKYGEVVGAFVVLAKGKTSGLDEKVITEELREWVREKLSNHLGTFIYPNIDTGTLLMECVIIVPKHIFVLPNSDGFPKTGSGKIQKFILKETAIKLLKKKQRPA